MFTELLYKYMFTVVIIEDGLFNEILYIWRLVEL